MVALWPAAANERGQCGVSGWTDLVAVAAGSLHTVGLKADGSAVACGANDRGQCEVAAWRDLVAIAAGFEHTVGLKADGSVIACGANERGQCEVSAWSEIVGIAAGGDHTVGLRADGRVTAVGADAGGQCGVFRWKLFDSLETLEEERRVCRQKRETQHKEAEQKKSGAEERTDGLFVFAKRRRFCRRSPDCADGSAAAGGKSYKRSWPR